MAAQPEPLSPKPRPSGYVWTIWADWNLVVKVGFGFLAAITLFAVVQFYFEDDNQKDSFAVALASLDGLPLERVPTQRQAKLLKRGREYSWRAIVWVRNGAELKPKIWHATIVHEGKAFRRADAEIADYQQQKAWSLELFDDIAAGPVPLPQ